MTRYPKKFKHAIQKALLPPNNTSVAFLAKTHGISKTTLYRWLNESMKTIKQSQQEEAKNIKQKLSKKSSQELLQVTINAVIKI